MRPKRIFFLRLKFWSKIIRFADKRKNRLYLINFRSRVIE